MAKNYSNTAAQVSLTASVNAVATTLPVSATTGFPAVNFTLVLGAGTVNEELVLVTGVAGTNLTVTRGYDNTTAVSHDSGTAVQHVHSAEDFALSRAHEAATSGVHGVTGALVGTTATQALTNKDLSSGNTFPSSLLTASSTVTLTNKTISVDNNTVSGVAASSFVLSNASGNIDGAAAQKVVPTGAVVGTTDTQTLANKTLASPDATGDLSGFGPAWSTYTPTWTTSGTAPAIGNGTLAGRYMQIGQTVHFRVKVTFGSTSTFGTGLWSFALPVLAHSGEVDQPKRARLIDSGSAVYPATFTPTSTTVGSLVYGSPEVAVTSTAPFTWTNGDFLTIEGTYEAA